MNKFEYVVALAAVITGVGLTDVAVSLHRLLKRRAGVVWDWVPVTLALYASMVLMRLWYQLWSVRELPLASGLPFITVQVVQTLVLILVVSAALPDDEDFERRRIDLRAYYATHARYVWAMYLVFLMMSVSTLVYVASVRGRAYVLLDAYLHAFFLIPLVLTVAALFVGRRWQGVIVAVLIAHELAVPYDLLGLR